MNIFGACAAGNLNEIKNLTVHDREVVQIKDNRNWTCLHHAVKSGSVECVKYLLQLNGLDLSAATIDGQTALLIACSVKNVSREIVSILLDANNDIVNIVDKGQMSTLKYAVHNNRLDIVKLLIENGATVNQTNGTTETALQTAVLRPNSYNIIRYLLNETNCNPKLTNGWPTACFTYFCTLAETGHLQEIHIQCFEQLAKLTYDFDERDQPVVEAADMMEFVCTIKEEEEIPDEPIVEMNVELYSKFLELFYLSSARQYFVRKILEANLPSSYSLIALTYQVIKDNRKYYKRVRLHKYYLKELFSLFLVDESFFKEYIAGSMRGIAFNEVCKYRKYLYVSITSNETSPQKFFDFIKSLIPFGISLNEFFSDCWTYEKPHFWFNVLASLCTFVPLGIYWTGKNRIIDKHLLYRFNESDNHINDYKRIIGGHLTPTVVSLKNLTRMSIRKYLFQNYSHYSALSMMYSFCIPNELRNFLCYNFMDYKF